MKYLAILSVIMLLGACSSQPNRCNRFNAFQQCQDTQAFDISHR
ncbi:MAG TPA: hypothetical protein PLU16_13295 [Gallionellaceae bacterium]|jgi:uncharacterized lipoprotein YajG|nr:hypothetical protein [Gallionellaceae bacterium]HQS76184.1 hypothetical protein [Gallionellaceae bacterium]